MVLLLLGCTPQDVDSAEGNPGPTCDPLTLTLVTELIGDQLPATSDGSHADSGVGLGDLDGDGDLDALIAWPGGAFGMRNDGTGSLGIDDTIRANVAWPAAVSTSLADLDQDGDLDAFLGEYPTGNYILWNDGAAHFLMQELPDAEPDASPWGGAWGDIDGDGDLDLYVSSRLPAIEPELVKAGKQIGVPSYLYVNDGGAAFRRDDSRIPQEDNFGITFHSAWLDVDGDDDLDLYDANDWGHFVTPNRLLLNDGTGRFATAEDCRCDVPMYGMGVGVGDVHGDGLPDLYISNINSPVFLENIGGGTYVDATVASGGYIPPSDTNFTSWGTGFLDADRNGCMDIAVAFGRLGKDVQDTVIGAPGVDEGATDPDLQSNVLLLNDCSPHLHRATGLDFDTNFVRDRALAVGDLDQDGRPDIVTVGRDAVRVWLSGGGCDEGVTVRVAQSDANPSAIGARVAVTSGGRTAFQWMLPSTTGSSSAPELYFGLGESPDGVLSVHWPDGSETLDVPVQSGEVITVTP